jgi:hypothetical protein
MPHAKRNTSLGQSQYASIELGPLVSRIAAHCSTSERKERNRSNQWLCKCNRYWKRRKESFCPNCGDKYETK